MYYFFCTNDQSSVPDVARVSMTMKQCITCERKREKIHFMRGIVVCDDCLALERAEQERKEKERHAARERKRDAKRSVLREQEQREKQEAQEREDTANRVRDEKRRMKTERRGARNGVPIRDHIETLQAYVWSWLCEHPCISCGEGDPIVLEFDHIDPETKHMSISHAIHSGVPLSTLQEEIEKCQVLCANCHRRRTAEQQQSYRWLRSVEGH